MLFLRVERNASIAKMESDVLRQCHGKSFKMQIVSTNLVTVMILHQEFVIHVVFYVVPWECQRMIVWQVNIEIRIEMDHSVQEEEYNIIKFNTKHCVYRDGDNTLAV